MIRKRTIGTLAALGGLTLGLALLSGAPAAKADEVTQQQTSPDLQTNPELLKRLDQLAQVGTAKPVEPPGTPTIAGSYPRSFLIPGTDTSLSVGGFAQLDWVYYLEGGTATGNEGTPNNGGGGAIQSIPLNNLAGQKFGTAVLSAAGIGNTSARSSNIFQMAARRSNLHVETRTPTDWGEADTVVELDFYGCSSGGADCDNLNHSTNPALVRLRLAYGTLGGFIAGQATVPVTDNAATAELIDFGGSFGSFGYARAPQVGYKMPLPWLNGATFGFYAVDPDTEVSSPVGAFETDSVLGVPGTNNPNAPFVSGTTPTAGTAVGAAASTTIPFASIGTNPAKSPLPDLNLVLEWQQPWGHLRLAGVIKDDELQDGFFVSQNYIAYGGAITGAVHPAWFGWEKDNLGFGFFAGSGLGDYTSSSGGGSTTFTNALVTNYGGVGAACNITTGVGCYGNGNGAAANPLGPIGNTAANAKMVTTQTVDEWGGNINYQHWWLPNLRSTIDWGITHQDIPINIVLANATTAGYNKEMWVGHLNLMWSPVPFIDTGLEWTIGERVTIANTKGQDNSIAGTFKVKF